MSVKRRKQRNEKPSDNTSCTTPKEIRHLAAIWSPNEEHSQLALHPGISPQAVKTVHSSSKNRAFDFSTTPQQKTKRTTKQSKKTGPYSITISRWSLVIALVFVIATTVFLSMLVFHLLSKEKEMYELKLQRARKASNDLSSLTEQLNGQIQEMEHSRQHMLDQIALLKRRVQMDSRREVIERYVHLFGAFEKKAFAFGGVQASL